MDALAVEVVKEYLRGHGYARTLRAFDASLLTRTVAAPAAGTAAAASKKSTAFEPPVFAATVDAALARLDKMMNTLRPSAPLSTHGDPVTAPRSSSLSVPPAAAPAPAPAKPAMDSAAVAALLDMALADAGLGKGARGGPAAATGKPRMRGRQAEEIVIEDEEDEEPPVPQQRQQQQRGSGAAVTLVPAPASFSSAAAPGPPPHKAPAAALKPTSQSSWFVEPAPEPAPAPVFPATGSRNPFGASSGADAATADDALGGGFKAGRGASWATGSSRAPVAPAAARTTPPASHSSSSTRTTAALAHTIVLDDADEFDDGGSDNSAAQSRRVAFKATSTGGVGVTRPATAGASLGGGSAAGSGFGSGAGAGAIGTAGAGAGAPARFMPVSTGVCVTEAQAVAMRQLLGGADKRPLPAFHKSWHQGLLFSAVPDLGYGLLQPEGGPCGALAVLQAYVHLHLLWQRTGGSDSGAGGGDDVTGGYVRTGAGDWKNPSASLRRVAIVRAVRDVVWGCVPAVSGVGSRTHAVLALVGARPVLPRSAAAPHDGLTEMLMLHRCATVDALEALIEAHLDQFTTPVGPGVPLVVYSALLTRGLDADGVSADMDQGFGECTMIGKHNYATQELVNLLLFGRAHSNVFNGTHVLAGDTSATNVNLRGAPRQGLVGMLSLFENYGHLEVGSFLKNPKLPIWVVCSESHYTCVFGVDLTPLDPSPSKPVDVYYYDGLGQQDEEIRLTVTPTPSPPVPNPTSEEHPPLDLCVRTRWIGAAVNWNGAEPLL